MTGARILWILLCGAATFLSWVKGLSSPLAGMILLACAPVVIGLLGHRVRSRWADEIEMAAWMLTATAAAAMTGGANSSLNLQFALPIATAFASGRTRLAMEAAAFTLVGFMSAAVFAGMGYSKLTADALQPAPAFLTGAALIYLAALAARWRLGAQRAINSARALAQSQAEARRALAKRYLAAVEEARNLKQSMDQRTGFFAQTSHELRTPLNAILGFSEAMKTQLFGPLPKRYFEYAELIHEGGKLLQVIVDDVLDLSKIEAGRYQISPIRTSLSEIVEEAVRFLSDQARREKRSLKLIRRGEDVEAFADPRAVRQVALNLISNAIKYAPRGGEVVVRVTREPSGALLSVRDNGPGMDQALFDRLKQPFAQGGDASQQRTAPKGTGLGLTVAEAFMRLHGSTLQLKQPSGQGAEILARFPDLTEDQ